MSGISREAAAVYATAGPPSQDEKIRELVEGPFDWTHNQNNRITDLDNWFRVDATTRLLNDPIDTRAAPNVHAAQSRNVMTSSFDAIFMNPLTNSEETHTLGTSTVGYPPAFRRP